jgi:predicted alpha/beta-hydrolase family hydrolase
VLRLGTLEYPANEPFATLLLAHGAGAGQKHPYMVGTAERLRARGVSVVTFDFAYMQEGRRAPDRKDALEARLRDVYAAVKVDAEGPMFAGGKSMGGRIATQCAAAGTIDPVGLVLLGYPLHPPGKPEQRRDAHLPKVKAPMLFVQGSRDAFGTREEIEPLVAKLAKTTKGTRAYVIDGGDHSHAVPKRGGVPQADVYEQVADAIAAWMREVAR